MYKKSMKQSKDWPQENEKKPAKETWGCNQWGRGMLKAKWNASKRRQWSLSNTVDWYIDNI